MAIPSGLAWGVIVDRVGPARAMRWLLAMWTVNMLFSVAIPWLDLPLRLWWGVGVVSGILLPGIWTADRPFLLRLTSARYLGEVFGLRSMTGRLSAMVGPFAWGLISVTLGFGQPAAVLSLAVSSAIAFVLIRGIDDRIRTASEDTQDRQLRKTDA